MLKVVQWPTVNVGNKTASMATNNLDHLNTIKTEKLGTFPYCMKYFELFYCQSPNCGLRFCAIMYCLFVCFWKCFQGSFFCSSFEGYGLVICPLIFTHISPVIFPYSFPFMRLCSTLEIPVIRARHSAGLIMQHLSVFIEVHLLKFAQLLWHPVSQFQPLALELIHLRELQSHTNLQLRDSSRIFFFFF